MVKIRLARFGRKGRPFYRIVVANSTAPRDGSHKCVLGTYDPLDHTSSRFKIDLKLFDYWVGVGAHPTDVVSRIVKNIRSSS